MGLKVESHTHYYVTLEEEHRKFLVSMLENCKDHVTDEKEEQIRDELCKALNEVILPVHSHYPTP